MQSNLYSGNAPRDFWVWVNPSNWIVRHQVTLIGSFGSVGSVERGKSNLPLIQNPEFSGDISPFTIGVMHQYRAEYNFEVNREHYFPLYPSRLNAIYLLLSEEEAMTYHARHMDHVNGRVLKKVHTIGAYAYSTHDSSWVDFLRLGHGCDDETIHHATQAYWRGISVEDCQTQSMGKLWTQAPIVEALFLGRIGFYDRTLPL